jgi:hypothetical protein
MLAQASLEPEAQGQLRRQLHYSIPLGAGGIFLFSQPGDLIPQFGYCVLVVL